MESRAGGSPCWEKNGRETKKQPTKQTKSTKREREEKKKKNTKRPNQNKKPTQTSQPKKPRKMKNSNNNNNKNPKTLESLTGDTKNIPVKCDPVPSWSCCGFPHCCGSSVKGHLEEFGFLCWPRAPPALSEELKPGEEGIIYLILLCSIPQTPHQQQAAG